MNSYSRWSQKRECLAINAHRLMPRGHPGDAFITEVTEELKHHHRISHATLQIETNPATQCNLRCDAAA
jgi:cobalt-zinc-cadmium efflux system protein